MALRLVVFLVAMAGVLVAPSDLSSCGPFIPHAIFTHIERYEAGGIVFKDFKEESLVRAYRVLSGITEPSPNPAAKPIDSASDPDRDLWKWQAPQGSLAAAKWSRERSNVPGLVATAPLGVERRLNQNYQTFVNCLDGAFEAATRTLKERAKKWGPSSSVLKEWVRGQDVVFSNCGGGEHIPEAVPASADPLLKADREYQIASAEFYAGKWALAEQQFQQVGRNANSPWRPMAQYLIARTLIRESSLDSVDTAMTQAEGILQGIVKDPALTALHPASRSLLSLIRARSEPQKALAELGSELTTPRGIGKLDEYLNLRRKLDSQQLTEAAEHDDLTRWLNAMDRGTRDMWKSNAGVQWLVMSLATSRGTGTDAELLKSARAVPKSSPAYTSAVYYGAEMAPPEVARPWLEDTLRERLSQSDRNAFLEQRMALAQDWVEFLRFAPRMIVADYWDPMTPLTPEFAFDDDSADVFNERIPLKLWLDASEHGLPTKLGAEVAVAGWVRAVALDRNSEALSFADRVAQLRPDFAKLMADFRATRDAGARKFLAVFLMLRTPGLHPVIRSGFGRRGKMTSLDPYRDNWWNASRDDKRDVMQADQHPGSAAVRDSNHATFLTASDHESGQKEADELEKLAGNGPNYLSAEAVRWVRAHPGDSRGPEALARAVKASRYSLSNGETGKYSKAAYDLLKSTYKGTTWEKQTPYWYK